MTPEEIMELALWRISSMFDGQAGARMALMRKTARDALAQAMEAQRAATVKQGAVADESAVPEGNAP